MAMAKVHVCNVVVLDNPSHFKNPFQFEITFECIEVNIQGKFIFLVLFFKDLPEDLEWKIIYVGSAESEEYDQVERYLNSMWQYFLANLGSRYCVRGARSGGPPYVRLSGTKSLLLLLLPINVIGPIDHTSTMALIILSMYDICSRLQKCSSRLIHRIRTRSQRRIWSESLWFSSLAHTDPQVKHLTLALALKYHQNMM